MLTLNTGLLLLACAFVRAAFAYDTTYNHTFELVGDQICEVFTVVEHPKVVETYVKENKVVTFENCDETITIKNAPTHIRTTITHKVTMDPCPPETCTDDRCHPETKTITETITPCKENRCTTRTITYTITKTRTHPNGRPSGRPHGECHNDNHCKDDQCCNEHYQCGYGPGYCGEGCQPRPGKCDESPKGRCLNGDHCKYGECCSEGFYCGKGPKFCGEGCHPELGECYPDKPERCLNGKRCKKHQCCSEDYYCGNGPEFCGEGCRPDLGKCYPIESTTAEPTSTPTPPPPDRCLYGQRCAEGLCCSEEHFCGFGEDFCGSGCRPDLGRCDAISSTAEPTSTPTSPPGVRCLDGIPCLPGGCCSEDYYCGFGEEFCGPGCHPDLGFCFPSGSTVSEPSSTATPPPGARCLDGQPCPYGQCCSEDYFCGVGEPFCGEGCHPDLGICYPERCLDGNPCGGGQCCSEEFYCGTGQYFCGAGCHPNLGQCDPVLCGADAPNPLCPVIPGTDNFRYCCGMDSICGLGPEFCASSGCQPEYGYCYPTGPSTIVEPTMTETMPPATPTGPVVCGPGNLCPFIPGTDGFWYCCGADFTCGLGPEFCGPDCQPEYGYCYPISSTFTIPDFSTTATQEPTSPTLTDVSTTATQEPSSTIPPDVSSTVSGVPSSTLSTPVILCGEGLPDCGTIETPDGPALGCCSADGICGVGLPFCGPDCQPEYGYCPPPPPIACGEGLPDCPNFDTPNGPIAGCCSAGGFCGIGDGFCGPGCQPDYGACNPTPPECGEGIGECLFITVPILGSIQQCCSAAGFCGLFPLLAFCGAGCQPDYGFCFRPPPVRCGFGIGDCPEGDCCSVLGFCGSSPLFCGPGCQEDYGTCNPPPPECGEGIGSCDEGECCNSAGYCGTGTQFCGPGCQDDYGFCPPPPPDCGFGVGVCPGGQCCNGFGYCGAGESFCGVGCQDAYGFCPPPPQECGLGIGSCPTPGDCCNAAGYCGVGDEFCGDGCQGDYGTCPETPVCGPGIGNCAGEGECCSADGQCGADFCGVGCQQFGATCLTCGPDIGACDEGTCCGANGFCGTGDDFCGEGCQPFGDPCAVCGPGIGSCVAGQCCSAGGQCGVGDDFCGVGCQPFGAPCQICGPSIGSCPEGQCCGGIDAASGFCGLGTPFCGAGCQPPFTGPGATCQECGPSIGPCDTGECCNDAGLCGTTNDFCGAGCQEAFSGNSCQECGPGIGSCTSEGECCSVDGFCGTATEFCDAGCQGDFGFCNPCTFVDPPLIAVQILPFLVRRFCCEWFTILEVNSCAAIDALFGLSLAELELLNPGVVGPGCGLLQVGTAYCVRGTPPFFSIQARNSDPPLTPSVEGLLLEGRTFPDGITGFDISDAGYDVDLYYGALNGNSFNTRLQVLRARDNGGVNNPPTVRLNIGLLPIPNTFVLSCTIVDGSGIISCTANDGEYTQFSICRVAGAAGANRRNLCLGDGTTDGNWVANVELYAVAP